MPGYATKQPPFDGARAEQYRAEIARGIQITSGDAAFKYWTEERGIPAATVLGCPDLLFLGAPVAGRNHVDSACVSLLRPTPEADPVGAELACVDTLGRLAATKPNRVQWRFVENGCRDAWFFAGGSGDTATVAESFGAKPLALLAAGAPGLVLGWGSRAWLRHKKLPPGIQKLIIVTDRRPAEGELGPDGKSLREAHNAAYRARRPLAARIGRRQRRDYAGPDLLRRVQGRRPGPENP
jgi:hypothetical protein